MTNSSKKSYKIKIDREELKNLLNLPSSELPKYSSPLLNLANRFSQATRPKNVGSLSELFQKYLEETPPEKVSIESWKKWYLSKYSEKFEKAKRLIKSKLEEFKKLLNTLSDEEIEAWLEDLMFNKTFEGLYIQKPILEKLRKICNCENYRLASKEEESKNIDGFLICHSKEIPVQIKPSSYKEQEKHLPENIEIPIIFYEKTKDGLIIDYSQLIQFLHCKN